MKIRHKVKADNVLLKIETGEIKSKGGIIVAAASNRECDAREIATIEQMGNQAFADYDEEEKYQVGDKVLISRYSGKTCGTYEDGLERRVIVDTGCLAEVIETEAEELTENQRG